MTHRLEAQGTFGVVATTHKIASQVGMMMLEQGGNAFDAAVAIGLTLQAVEPCQTSLGGEVVIVGKSTSCSEPFVLCGQGPAPCAATIERYRAEGYSLMPGTGLMAAVVPGVFGAWMTLLKDHGRLGLADVMQPAIWYSRHGHPISALSVRVLSRIVDLVRSSWSTSASIVLPRGNLPNPGALFTNEALAYTYEKLLRIGLSAAGGREAKIQAAHDAFYQGFVAEQVERFVANNSFLDSSGEAHCGILTAEDFARWRPTYERPAQETFRNYTVFKPGPWSQGPVLLQLLKLLEPYPIEKMEPFGPDLQHLLIEGLKLAYADREAWYGDPTFVDVPLRSLLSEEYARARRPLIGETASMELHVGSIEGRQYVLPTYPSTSQVAEAREKMKRVATASGDTCHIDVMDSWGNVVAATPSGGWLQSSPVVEGLGFALSNRAQMFWLEPGLPASLGPYRRPRTTLSPTLAYRDDDSPLAFGCRGADVQDQWNAQFFIRHSVHNLSLQAAIDAPIFISRHCANSEFPRAAAAGSVTLSSDFPKRTIAELRGRGHQVRVVEPSALTGLGQGCAAMKLSRVLSAAAAQSMPDAGAAGR